MADIYLAPQVPVIKRFMPRNISSFLCPSSRKPPWALLFTNLFLPAIVSRPPHPSSNIPVCLSYLGLFLFVAIQECWHFEPVNKEFWQIWGWEPWNLGLLRRVWLSPNFKPAPWLKIEFLKTIYGCFTQRKFPQWQFSMKVSVVGVFGAEVLLTCSDFLGGNSRQEWDGVGINDF